MVNWSGPQTSRNRSHGTVKHSVKLLGVGATAPDWCAVLCSRVDQCQGGDFQGLGSGSPCASRKAADQGDTAVVFALRFSRCWRNDSVRSVSHPGKLVQTGTAACCRSR